jgi:hypothetical protein
MIPRRTTGLRGIGTLLSAAYLLAVVSQRSPAAAADGGDSAQPSTAVTLRGQVLLPDGKPAAGADLYWPHADSPPPRWQELRYVERGASDDGGRFQIALSAANLLASGPALYLVAHRAGFGIDWLKVEAGDVPAEITLRLVEDHPIRGRVTDTEHCRAKQGVGWDERSESHHQATIGANRRGE